MSKTILQKGCVIAPNSIIYNDSYINGITITSTNKDNYGNTILSGLGEYYNINGGYWITSASINIKSESVLQKYSLLAYNSWITIDSIINDVVITDEEGDREVDENNGYIYYKKLEKKVLVLDEKNKVWKVISSIVVDSQSDDNGYYISNLSTVLYTEKISKWLDTLNSIVLALQNEFVDAYKDTAGKYHRGLITAKMVEKLDTIENKYVPVVGMPTDNTGSPIVSKMQKLAEVTIDASPVITYNSPDVIIANLKNINTYFDFSYASADNDNTIKTTYAEKIIYVRSPDAKERSIFVKKQDNLTNDVYWLRNGSAVNYDTAIWYSSTTSRFCVIKAIFVDSKVLLELFTESDISNLSDLIGTSTEQDSLDKEGKTICSKLNEYKLAIDNINSLLYENDEAILDELSDKLNGASVLEFVTKNIEDGMLDEIKENSSSIKRIDSTIGLTSDFTGTLVDNIVANKDDITRIDSTIGLTSDFTGTLVNNIVANKNNISSISETIGDATLLAEETLVDSIIKNASDIQDNLTLITNNKSAIEENKSAIDINSSSISSINTSYDNLKNAIYGTTAEITSSLDLDSTEEEQCILYDIRNYLNSSDSAIKRIDSTIGDVAFLNNIVTTAEDNTTIVDAISFTNNNLSILGARLDSSIVAANNSLSDRIDKLVLEDTKINGYIGNVELLKDSNIIDEIAKNSTNVSSVTSAINELGSGYQDKLDSLKEYVYKNEQNITSNIISIGKINSSIDAIITVNNTQNSRLDTIESSLGDTVYVGDTITGAIAQVQSDVSLFTETEENYSHVIADITEIQEDLVDIHQHLNNAVTEDVITKKIEESKTNVSLNSYNIVVTNENEVILPFGYVVGSNELLVTSIGTILYKDLNYSEIGNTGEMSNAIKLIDCDKISELVIYKITGTANVTNTNYNPVNMPIKEDGTTDYGTEGQLAVSDGKGGIKWVNLADLI